MDTNSIVIITKLWGLVYMTWSSPSLMFSTFYVVIFMCIYSPIFSFVTRFGEYTESVFAKQSNIRHWLNYFNILLLSTISLKVQYGLFSLNPFQIRLHVHIFDYFPCHVPHTATNLICSTATYTLLWSFKLYNDYRSGSSTPFFTYLQKAKYRHCLFSIRISTGILLSVF